MRKIFTLAAAALCGIGATAQNSHKLPQSKPATPAKTTATDTRLISRSSFVFAGAGFDNEDSTEYRYTGSNGYDKASESWLYDSTIVWTWNNSSMDWEDNGRSYHQLSGEKVTSMIERGRIGGVWKDLSKVEYTYKNGLKDTYIYSFNMGTGLQPMSKEINVYNSANQLTETTRQGWNNVSGTWYNGTRQTFHLNSAGKVDTVWYDTWLGSAWQLDGRTVNVYTGGVMTSSTEQVLSASGWVNDARTSYTYNLKNLVTMVIAETWDATSSAWENAQRYEYDYNADDDVSEQRFAGWVAGAWLYGERLVYTYNSDHRILTEQSYTWNPGPGVWYQEIGQDRFRRNIYETYTTHVTDIPGNMTELDIYPVPATNKINIAASFKQAQPVVLTMVDIKGQIVKQMSVQAGAQYRNSIDVSDLPGGSYIIKLSGTSEQAAKTITIAH